VLELGRLHAPSTVTALARLGGRPVAVLASTRASTAAG
jgi:acetyl-CoA carboxylase carboxyltransferase component